MEKSAFLTVAIKAAKQAEEVILRHYSPSVEWKLKPDNTPVSLADTEAEAIIISTIKEAFPDHGFLGEESGDDHSTSGYQWIIDPIDGTKNFIRGIPLFATLIALMKDGEIIVGVSNMPALGEMLYAEKGAGAFREDQPISVSNVATLADAYMCHGGLKYFKKYHSVDALLTLVETAAGHRGFGDAWNYHLVAQGKADLAVEAQNKIWDIAPFVIIIEEAGGKVTDGNGAPITRSSTSTMASNGLVHDAALGIYKQD